MMAAYYNEIDPKAAAWLRELIKQGLIADGDVDERSIEDVTPNEIKDYTQCHFFAGIGGWSLTLRQAGWPDDRPVWTGSCPCQPFSAAGKGKGFADERHLWPAFFHLISVCEPAIIFGEQVGGKAGRAWFDLVQDDLEGSGFACGKVEFPACSVGAPMLSQRLYWVGKAESERPQRHHRDETRIDEFRRVETVANRCDIDSSLSGELGQTDGESSQRNAGTIPRPQGEVYSQGLEDGGLGHRHTDTGDASRMVTANGQRLTRRQKPHSQAQQPELEASGRQDLGRLRDINGAMPTDGFWRDVDWLFCRDGKWRPVEPGTFPLANGVSARVVRVRGYGNAIVVPQAQAFIEAYLETEGVAA